MEALDILGTENLVDWLDPSREGNLKHGKFLYKGEIFEVIRLSRNTACGANCDLVPVKGVCFQDENGICPTSFGFLFKRVT